MNALFRRVSNDERGSVLVILMGLLPLAVALAAFVIDVGNAMEHRRHLQLQADAAALAGAQEALKRCGKESDDGVDPDDRVRTEAEKYAGTDYNKQVGGDDAQSRVNIVVNGTGYGAETFSAGKPCEERFVEVRVTEDDSPAFFAFVGNHDYHAKARVEIPKIHALADTLPIAIPAPDPKSAAALFVNETTGELIKKAPLSSAGDEDDLSIWETEDPVTVPIPAGHVGVRIALSGGSSTDCSVSVPCYDAVDTTKGLVHIQGWSTAGSVSRNATKGLTSQPIVRSVALAPTTPACEDNRFMPSFSPSAPECTATKQKLAISAVVDFGGVPTGTTGVGGKVTAVVNGTATALTFDSTAPYTARGVISVPSGEGPIPIDLQYEASKGELPTGNPNKPTVCDDKNNNPCKWTAPDVQRQFRTADARSGPIELMQVSEPNVTDHASSLLAGEHQLKVKIGIGGTLQVSDPGDPPTVLRFDAGTSNTGMIRCNPPGNTVQDDLVLGCRHEYAVNEGTPCTGTIPTFPVPWQCVQTGSGQDANPIAESLNQRILGSAKPSSCPSAGAAGHNNWPDWEPGDPRIVHLFLTRFGAFDENGTHTVPVTGFAAFYITGWQGSGGKDNPCQKAGNGDDPAAVGTVVGRYIPDGIPNDGGGGDEPCDFQGITPCTAVLVE